MESKALQPFSSNATKSNLEFCGVPDGTGTARGHILANQIGPNGRPIAFVYSGDADEDDGTDDIFLRSDRMKGSVNFKQLEAGHAYPLFYDTLFRDLRMTMSDTAKEARANGEADGEPDNLWANDVTNTGAQYSGAASVETMQPIFPKLWRRLDTYSRDSDVGDPTSLSEFFDFLSSLGEERVLILSEARMTGFDNVIQIAGSSIKMTIEPEDIVVISR